MKTLLLTTALLLAATSTYAQPLPPPPPKANALKGTFSFVGNDSCLLIGSPGEGADLGTVGAYRTLNGTAQGFAVFNGDGTGTMTVQNNWFMTIYFGHAVSLGIIGNVVIDINTSLFLYNGTIAFTYTVTGDEFTITETSDSGPAMGGANAQLTIVGAPTVNGTISQNSPPVLQTATRTPANEQWIYDICANCVTWYTTCLRTRTYTKVNATD